MRSSYRCSITGVALLGIMLTVTPASAQTQYHVTRKPSELFAAFVRERQALNNQTNASLDLTHVLTYHSEYPPADVEWLLRELEQLSLVGEPEWLRAEAALRLSIPGSTGAVRPTAGTFARLERIYRLSSDPGVKSIVVAAMGSLIESQKASAFLGRVATQESPDFAGAPGRAMASLLTLGDDGRVVLKRLHETNTVRDREAEMDLATLAKNGYRVPQNHQK
jgi:hypothetical protein